MVNRLSIYTIVLAGDAGLYKMNTVHSAYGEEYLIPIATI